MTIQKQYEIVIFDVDGTLVDSSRGIIHAVTDTIEQMGFTPLDEKILYSFIGPPIYLSFLQQCCMDEQQSYEATEIFRRKYKDKFLFEATPYPGIYELLHTLKKHGFKMAVATNKREDYAKELLDYFRFTPFFDFIQGSDFENTLKKSDIIQLCLDALRVYQKSHGVMIGDTLEDAKAAQACGIDYIGVTYGFGFTEEHVPSNIITCRSTKEILTVLEGVDQCFKN